MERARKDNFEITNEKKTNDYNTNNTTNIKDKIRAEFEKYAKNPSSANLADLARKYKEDQQFIEEFIKYRNKKYKKIKKQARELAEKILRKYNNGTKPLHEILEKMLKYKADNKWSDYEYDEFRKELTNLLSGNRAMEIEYNQNLMNYRSRINKTLGMQMIEDTGLHIKDTEQGILEDILKMYNRYLPLHNSVLMQSLMYEDCSLVAITGEYKRDTHIASNYIHPILAAIYLPKFDIFEIHTLYSNFGGIVKARYERKPLITEPDALLYYDIISDPNDVVCEISSAITDLKNRYQVQITLWETVIKLRNGNYYEATPVNDFISALNVCRNNLYDNADLAFNRDEGSILRRFLNVFSLRPTIIATKPIYSVASFAAGPCTTGFAMAGLPMDQISQGLFPFNNQPVYTITSIAMITLQLPPLMVDNAEPKNLKDATRQTIWINENKTIIPKEQSIIYSKEVLIFYVNRRIQRIQIRTFSNPIAFSQLPLTMTSFDRLNKYPLNVPDAINIRNTIDERYELRSVVTVTETSIQQGGRETNIITGSNALIMTHRNPLKGVFDQTYLLYDPLGASLPVQHPLFSTIPQISLNNNNNISQQIINDCCKPDYNGYITNKPISYISGVLSPSIDGVTNPSFFERASTCGTIFIYAKPNGYSNNEILYM